MLKQIIKKMFQKEIEEMVDQKARIIAKKDTDRAQEFIQEKAEAIATDKFNEWKRKLNVSDLTRENLKSITIDFSSGKLPDYLSDLDEASYKARLANIESIWTNEAFQEIVKYLINTQGNFTLKEARSDAEIYTGRLNINGISLLKEEVERGHLLFRELTKPEEFDEFEAL